jgi:hypothetical protein
MAMPGYDNDGGDDRELMPDGMTNEPRLGTDVIPDRGVDGGMAVAHPDADADSDTDAARQPDLGGIGGTGLIDTEDGEGGTLTTGIGAAGDLGQEDLDQR